MSIPTISHPRVLESDSPKILCVTWDILTPADGEWWIEWDGMYSALPEDIRSAHSEQGAYFALENQRETSAATSNSNLSAHLSLPETDAPLSTARLLRTQ